MKIKLCYIWVSKFRNFENTGFNFSSSEKFNYNHNSGHLTMESIEKLPVDFFGKSIIEVSGIIGKNGSGKSNALELVCKLMKGGKTSVSDDFIIITKENNRFVCYRSKDAPWMLSFDFSMELRKYDRHIDPLKVVYFSNVFDERIHNFDKDVSDVSYNKRFKRYGFPSRSKTDFEKQIEFLNSGLFQMINIETPETIKITSKVFGNNYSADLRQRMYGDFRKELYEFSLTYRNRLKEIKSTNRFYYLLVFSFFEETLKNLYKYKSDNQANDYYLNEFIEFTGLYRFEKTEKMAIDLINWMDYISDNIIKNSKSEKGIKQSTILKDRLNKLIEFKEYLKNVEISHEAEGSRNRTTDYFLLTYNNRNKKIVFKFLELFGQNNSFEINWLGISSGHKAYLNIFSLLFYELKRIKRENLLLCIDEGDLYLHPQWQIEFFYMLIKVLPEIFNGSIQLILTSHSPFLLSDLPKQNITIVAPNESTSALNGTSLETETFAGNIYALYAEPFFLGNQRMSLFAKQKIDEIFEKLKKNDKRISKVKKRELEKEISLIGDKVIRFHLLKKLNND